MSKYDKEREALGMPSASSVSTINNSQSKYAAEREALKAPRVISPVNPNNPNTKPVKTDDNRSLFMKFIQGDYNTGNKFVDSVNKFWTGKEATDNKVLDTITRTGQTGANIFMGAKPEESSYVKPIDTGSKTLNTVSDVAGNIMGFTGAAKATGFLGGSQVGLMGKGLSVGQQAAGKLAQTGGRLGKLANTRLGYNVIEGAVPGALMDVSQGLKEGDNAKELAKRVGTGALFGGAIDAGMGAAGPLLRKLPALKNTPDVKTEAPNVETMNPDFYVNLRGQTTTELPEERILLAAPKDNAESFIRSGSYNAEKPFSVFPGEINKPKANNNFEKLLGNSEITVNTTSGPQKVNTKSITDNKGKTLKEAISPDVEETYKNILNDLEGASVRPDETVRATAGMIKDKMGLSYNMTDIYRNFKDAFGKQFDHVKRTYLDPLDASKKKMVDMEKSYTDNLYNNVVKKLGINKNSKLSKAVQEFGEGQKMAKVTDPQTGHKMWQAVPYTLDDLKADFPNDWEKAVEADKWFRQQYNTLIDQVNVSRQSIYPNNPSKLIPKRKDYYRHFREIADTFAGVKNLFETPSQIDPSLAGVSDFTKPRSRFLSFAQQRGMGRYDADAVGGFLDYIKAASYATHIDPHISKFRGLAKDIAESTGNTRNANNLIEYLQDFANDLAGKTNALDRAAQKYIGRKTFKVINWINSRVKANTVLGNVSSSLSQIANVPQGIAFIKNPAYLTKGAGDTMASFLNQGKLSKVMDNSQFLSERFSGKLYSRFDTRMIDQPKRFAAWMLGALDEVGTKFIWSSAYNKAVAEGIPNAIKYADDNTRRLVAGRGVGEMALMQKSKVFQLFAPFQVEVANLWSVQKDFVKEKDLGGLMMLYLANYVLNKGMEEVRGSGVVFDPIAAIEDSLKEDLSAGETAGRLAGEVLSNMPGGQTVATWFPEYGTSVDLGFGEVEIPSREKLFGDNDPTRFGSGLLTTKAFRDPLHKIVLPFGGAQVKKTKTAIETLKTGGSYTNKGDRLRTPVRQNASNAVKGVLFGEGGIKEVKEFFDSNALPLGTNQTENFKKIVDEGADPYRVFSFISKHRGVSKKTDILKAMQENKTLTQKEKLLLLSQFYGYKPR